MKFIILHITFDTQICLNVSKIVYFEEKVLLGKRLTYIRLDNEENGLFVMEPYEQVIEMLDKALGDS